MKKTKIKGKIVVGEGVKCDCPGCDFTEGKSLDEFKFEYIEDYEVYIRSYLSKGCPKCGAPLMKEEDVLVAMFVVKLCNFWLVRFINWIGSKVSKKKHLFKVEFKGEGKIDVTDCGPVKRS